MKKFLSLFCAVLMAVASVRAEGPASITPLTNGDNSVVIDNPTSGSEWSGHSANSSQYTLFSYTALGNGIVTIYAVGDKDTYGAFFDKDWNFIDSSDGWDYSENAFELNVMAGDVLYIGARGYYDYEIGSYTIHVDGPLAPCEAGSHTMSHVETPVTCTTDGIKSHYACSTCLHTYSDAEGAEEILDVTIPALGHNIVDEKCTHEGCGLDVSSNMLQNGDNNVVIDNPTSGEEWDDNRKNYLHYTLFKYTALGNGKVAICLVGDDDTYAALYDKDWNYIEELAFWDDESDVYLTFDVKAGDVYYIGARGYYDEEIGSYTIHVDGPLAPCEVGHHTMSLVETPVTCTTDGIKSHYACSTCLHKYSDAEGTEEIDDLTIPALGHHMVGDKCTNEGCGLDVSSNILQNGDNNVVIDNLTSGEKWDSDRMNYKHYTLFKYTALGNGKVAIYAVGDKDTYGAIFDNDWSCIDESDAWDDSEYAFELSVKAGDVYYIGARGYRDKEIGSYKIHVDGPLTPCEVGHHTLIPVETPVTCTTDGLKAHYACSTCLHTYSDAEGEDEIYDLTIPALGHNIVGDKCTHEGCGLVVSTTPLTMGENSVVIDNPTTGEEWENNNSNYLHYTLFKYPVQTDCNLVIYAEGKMDTYGALFDKDLKHITTSDDGHNSDFMFIIDAKAGDVYYIGARGYDDEEIGSYIIKVAEKTAEAAIGDVIYNSLYDALDGAQDGETVTLIADIEYPNGGTTEFENYGTITLDLNGHTMYGYIYNEGHLTIEDSSEGKTGKMITLPDAHLLKNDDEDYSITINGGTFVGGTITYENGVYYINGGTFILPDESNYGYTMSGDDNIIFGDGVVYHDLSGEHDDISEVTENVTYSGKFVKVGTPTAIKDVDASKANKAQKTIKTIENGRVVIIRDGVRYDITGRKL